MAETHTGEIPKSKQSPFKKWLSSTLAGLTIISAGTALKNCAPDEATMRQHEIDNAIKVKNDTKELIKTQSEIIERKKMIDSGNIGIDRLAISALENEVYRYATEDQLKPFENGTTLLPDQIAILNLKDSTSYSLDGKIKVGVYDTVKGEFRLIPQITNYQDVDDSPKAVISLITREGNELNPINQEARYKLAIINDGVHDCEIGGGSIEETYQQIYDKYLQHGEVCFNQISLDSEIIRSNNLDQPILNIIENENVTYTFKQTDTGVTTLRAGTKDYENTNGLDTWIKIENTAKKI